eukprot:c8596_g1_i1.p2 GENE.c8596_g1_i1~~c8596_g1_i1.p2  ORF type:complete len:191 (-),score=81.62 c8596_g1_i1:57-629(-)
MRISGNEELVACASRCLASLIQAEPPTATPDNTNNDTDNDTDSDSDNDNDNDTTTTTTSNTTKSKSKSKPKPKSKKPTNSKPTPTTTTDAKAKADEDERFGLGEVTQEINSIAVREGSIEAACDVLSSAQGSIMKLKYASLVLASLCTTLELQCRARKSGVATSLKVLSHHRIPAVAQAAAKAQRVIVEE